MGVSECHCPYVTTEGKEGGKRGGKRGRCVHLHEGV